MFLYRYWGKPQLSTADWMFTLVSKLKRMNIDQYITKTNVITIWSTSPAEVNHVRVLLAKTPICGLHVIQNARLSKTTDFPHHGATTTKHNHAFSPQWDIYKTSKMLLVWRVAGLYPTVSEVWLKLYGAVCPQQDSPRSRQGTLNTEGGEKKPHMVGIME